MSKKAIDVTKLILEIIGPVEPDNSGYRRGGWAFDTRSQHRNGLRQELRDKAKALKAPEAPDVQS